MQGLSSSIHEISILAELNLGLLRCIRAGGEKLSILLSKVIRMIYENELYMLMKDFKFLWFRRNFCSFFFFVSYGERARAIYGYITGVPGVVWRE